MKTNEKSPLETLSEKIVLDDIQEAIYDIKAGKMVIVVDDENRENEGDFIMAADKVTPQHINFMAKEGRGIICCPLGEKRAKALGLNPMVEGPNTSHLQTAFTVTIDLIEGNTTGISCDDRARTVLALTNPETKPEDFMRPGHIFPLIAREGGVLTRDGHTEAAVDLAQLAGLTPIGLICEIMNEDGSMARLPDLLKLAQKHQMKIISIKDLVAFRKKKALIPEAKTKLPTKYGEFDFHVFLGPDGKEHMALSYGNFPEQKDGKKNENGQDPVLVRIHSECITGDIFKSLRCDCGDQLDRALKAIVKAGKGILLYLKQEGRGIGLVNKVRAYNLQDQGLDTVDANHALGLETDLRDYQIGIQILSYFNIKKVSLLTNNPLKIGQLKTASLEITQRVPLEIGPNEKNHHYLLTKKNRMGHMIL